MAGLRMTYPTAMVLQALAAGYKYGFDIAEATGLRGGTVYPLLRRLEERRLVSSRWEDVAQARAEGRPSRKYYHLVGDGWSQVEAARRRFPMTAWPEADGQGTSNA